MNATRADYASSSIVGSHYVPVELSRQYPMADSLQWGQDPGKAELIDAAGTVLATFDADEDDDGDMSFVP